MQLSSKIDLKPDTSIGTIRKRLGKGKRERKRSSQTRRLYLERVARIITGLNVQVAFVPRQAGCRQLPEHHRSDYLINIPTDIIPEQAYSNLDDEVWDLVFQEAEVMHELGHVLYSDFETIESMKSYVDGSYNQLFKIWNIIEDGAIERALANDYNVGNDLLLKNANLLNPDIPANTGLKYFKAVQAFLLDYAKYDSGLAGILLDPTDDRVIFWSEYHRNCLIAILPELADYTRRMIEEPNGTERVRLARELYEDVIRPNDPEPTSEIEPPSGTENAVNPDAEKFVGSGENRNIDSGVTFRVRGSVDTPDDDGDGVDYSGDEETDESERERLESEAESKAKSQLQSEDEPDTTPEEDEAEKIVELMGEIDCDHWNPRVVIPYSGSYSKKRYEAAKRRSKTIRHQWEKALQHERESAIRRNQLAGSIDQHSMHKAERGNPRVWQREDAPDDKDYSVILILDRSGSMDTDQYRIGPAEEAVGSMAMALEDIGVETEILSLADRKVTLDKPFGEPVEEHKATVFSGFANGGSPFDRPLMIARERLNRRDGEKFIVFVNDGTPNIPEFYADELDKCTFPVVGVYVGDDVTEESIDSASMFHAWSWAKDPSDAPRQVKQMVSRLVL